MSSRGKPNAEEKTRKAQRVARFIFWLGWLTWPVGAWIAWTDWRAQFIIGLSELALIYSAYTALLVADPEVG